MDSLRQCAVCGSDYAPVMQHQRYCSRPCHGKRPQPYAAMRARYERSTERRACAHCGASFVYHPKLRTTYCSVECARLSGIARRAIGRSCQVPWRQCQHCGSRFVAQHKRAYCEPLCTEVARRAQGRAKYRETYVPTPARQYECVVCHATFERDGRHGSPKTCSMRCAGRLPSVADGKRRRRARKRGVGLVRYKRDDIYERDGWRCQLCGTAVRRDAKAPHPKSPTIDHIIPLAAGGPDAPINVQLAHFICNSRKGAGGGQLRWTA